MQRSSGEELSKSTSTVHAFIAENYMNYTILQSTTFDLNVKADRTLQRMLYRRVVDVIRKRVVEIGLIGCEPRLDIIQHGST